MYNMNQNREMMMELLLQRVVVQSQDALGILGWDKVDRLARAFIGLNGISVTNDQARHIQQLYAELHKYDKRPLTFTHRYW